MCSNGKWLLGVIYFCQKLTILDVWQGFEYASGYYDVTYDTIIVQNINYLDFTALKTEQLLLGIELKEMEEDKKEESLIGKLIRKSEKIKGILVRESSE